MRGLKLLAADVKPRLTDRPISATWAVRLVCIAVRLAWTDRVSSAKRSVSASLSSMAYPSSTYALATRGSWTSHLSLSLHRRWGSP